MKKLKLYLISYWSDGQKWPSTYTTNEQFAINYCKHNLDSMYEEIDELPMSTIGTCD